MTERVLGEKGSMRRKRFLLLPILATAALALFWIAGAQAVHDVGVFQLDQNAITTELHYNDGTLSPPALEDWDLICKANPVTATRPNGCTFVSGFSPSGTTVAKPSSFIKDPSESSTDDILKGGTKDDNEITSWTWNSAKPSPPKNDLTDGYAAAYTCNDPTTPPADNNVSGCTGTAGDKLLYFGADRLSNNGSANIAFWFFQKKVVQKADGTGAKAGQCVSGGGCPFVGADGNAVTHTAGNCSLPNHPNPCTPGDVLAISAFGPKAQIFIFEWVGTGKATKDYLGTSQCFTQVCTLQPLFIGNTLNASDCQDVTADNACAISNDTSQPSPWVLPQAGNPDNNFAPTDFFEGGLNLTKLGLANACFSSYLINSRSSAAGDAELHDKILGQFAVCAPGLTTQASASIGSPVAPGTAVTDRATITVTGATSPDDAQGNVTFFLCAKDVLDCSTGGTQIGTAVALTNAACSPPSPNGTDGKSCAVSLSVNDDNLAAPRGKLSPGIYCFRAEADLTNYDDPASFHNSTTECFKVTDTSSTTTAQNWLPNDTATVTLGSGGAATVGSVTFTLYSNATCSPGTGDVNVLHVFGPINVDSNGKASTSNYPPGTTYGVALTPGRTISWKVTYSSGDANIGGSTSHCETSTVTINDDLGS